MNTRNARNGCPRSPVVGPHFRKIDYMRFPSAGAGASPRPRPGLAEGFPSQPVAIQLANGTQYA